MEEFEVRAISSVPYLPHVWLRYVDDTFVIQQAEHCHQFLQCISSLAPHIQFTTEQPKEYGYIPLFDTLVCPGPNNTLTTTVYFKLTHMDQYLHWDSNLFLMAKHSIYNTLSHRARVVCISQNALHQEDHIRQALLKCSSPLGPSTTYIPRFITDYTQTACT